MIFFFLVFVPLAVWIDFFVFFDFSSAAFLAILYNVQHLASCQNSSFLSMLYDHRHDSLEMNRWMSWIIYTVCHDFDHHRRAMEGVLNRRSDQIGSDRIIVRWDGISRSLFSSYSSILNILSLCFYHLCMYLTPFSFPPSLQPYVHNLTKKTFFIPFPLPPSSLISISRGFLCLCLCLFSLCLSTYIHQTFVFLCLLGFIGVWFGVLTG